MSSSSDERRGEPRQRALVLVEVTSGALAGRHGITRDLTRHGILIASQSRFVVGDRIDVKVRTSVANAERRARVVRVEQTPRTEEWRYRVALELEEPLPPELVAHGVEAETTFVKGPSKPPPPLG